MASKYGFLATIKLKENITEAVVPVQQLLRGMTLRVFKNNKVTPSKELIEFAKLEYWTEIPEKENGLDFFKSSDWTPYPKDAPACILIGITPRTEVKVDLFAGAKAKTTKVEKQGPKSPELVAYVDEVFPGCWNDEGFVDLQIFTENRVETENQIYNIPKKFKKGTKKGTLGYQRRENISIFPCEPYIVETNRQEEPQSPELISQLI